MPRIQKLFATSSTPFLAGERNGTGGLYVRDTSRGGAIRGVVSRFAGRADGGRQLACLAEARGPRSERRRACLAEARGPRSERRRACLAEARGPRSERRR